MASSSGSGGGGAMSDPISPPSGSTHAKVTDGWDNEEWGSLEEEPVRLSFEIIMNCNNFMNRNKCFHGYSLSMF